MICPICLNDTCISNTANQMQHESGVIFLNYGNCKICGEFFISLPFLNDCIEPDNFPRYVLSGVFRNLTEEKKRGLRKNLKPMLSYDDLNNAMRIPETPVEKLDLLLIYFYNNQKNLSNYIKFRPGNDYSICFAENVSEATEYIKILFNYDYLQCELDNPFSRTNMGEHLIIDEFKLTIDGWTKAHEILSSTPNSKQAFIAMHFDDNAKKLLDISFFPALKECGYKPYSSLKDEHNESITDKIIANIRKSGLVIADLTGARQNVYYEAGFAKGLGIPVIFTCKESYFSNDSKFDVSHIKHVTWKDENDLKEKLINRINASGLSKV